MKKGRSLPLDAIQRRRAFITLGAQGLLALGLGSRLIWLQGTGADKFFTRAEGNRINVRVLVPQRAKILDRNGLALALDRFNYRALIIPEQAGDIDKALARFSATVPLSDATIARIKRNAGRQPKFFPLRITEHLDWETFAKLNLKNTELDGIILERGFKRYFPFGFLTGHTVGYVGGVTKNEISAEDRLSQQPDFYVGRRGVELQFDQNLRGIGGSETVEVNSAGRVVRVLEKKPGIESEAIKLHLDIRVQQLLAKELSPFRRGAGVVIDTKTGGIISMVSHPAFDPNILSTGIDTKTWQGISQHDDSPLHNRALAGQYAPGSTFKIASLLAGLEAGVAQKLIVNCKGRLKFGDRVFHCWRRRGHGKVGHTPAFAQSCDIWFYELALKVGLEKVVATANKLGLGGKTGLDISGESNGLLPSREWKRKVQGSPWRDGDSMITYIGQGYVLCTPIQLATMIARVASGRAVVPRMRIDEEEVAEFPKLDFDPEHLDIVRNALFQVVQGKKGTGTAARIEPSMAISGKTGTSQVRNISSSERTSGVVDNEDLQWKLRDHALFVGMAPSPNAQLAAAIVIEHAGSGGHFAAPVCARVLRHAQMLRRGEA